MKFCDEADVWGSDAVQQPWCSGLTEAACDVAKISATVDQERYTNLIHERDTSDPPASGIPLSKGE